MALKDYAALVGNYFAGNTLSQTAQVATAEMFKKGLGAAIIVTLIAGFAGQSGYMLGMTFLYVFSFVYGIFAWKWLQTPDGKQAIDQRMGTDREKEVPVAGQWGLFTYAIVFGTIIAMLIPSAIMHQPIGLWVSVVLLMGSPAAIYWRHRKEI